MMMSPNTFLKEYENASYFELLKLKNELIQKISDFESDVEQNKFRWGINPSPDVHYQWDLETLSKVSNMLKEAFNKEYERGDKNISDYYKEMKERSK